uniref:C-type lectin domain-containing protein n=1 Tax=Oreochromis niloticus TaxID=8128 RepID=A0A669BZR7_ORENI
MIINKNKETERKCLIIYLLNPSVMLALINISCLMFLPEKTCASGWRMFSCSCYLLSEKTGSWDEGRSDCRDRGADLVVIDSSEEQDFLVSFTQKQTWIGLNDKEEEGRWKWVDGTPLTSLTFWSPRQPDNGGEDPQWGEEDCVHIRTDGNTLWNDRSCRNSFPWVCEKIP